MNKHSKKIVKTVGIIALVFLGLVFFRGCFKTYISPHVDPNAKYDIYGQDKYTYFGDARFQVMSWATDMNKLQLLDFYGGGFPSFYVIREIDRYILMDNILYVAGDFSSGTTNLETGDRIYYSSASETPQFMVLNIDNGDAEYYLSLEESPESDKTYFEMDLTGEECLKDRTCYEKGADTKPSWWNVLSEVFKNSFS